MTKCEVCGSPVKVLGTTTMHYVPMYDELKKKTDKLETLLQAIKYAMISGGTKDEKFYLNLGSAIEQTLKDYEK